MTSFRILSLSFSWAVLSSLCASDMSRHREFHLDTDLPAVLEQAGMKPAEVKVLHQRPALIQELSWQPQRQIGPSRELDPVKEVVFTFYNGELFRMIVTYDRYRPKG